MSLTGLGEIADLAKDVIDKVFPDKSEEEKAKIAAAFQLANAQIQANAAEATQPGLHFRDGAGWVCVAGFAVDLVIRPLTVAISSALGHPFNFAPLDISTMMPMLMALLGLGGMHVYEQTKS